MQAAQETDTPQIPERVKENKETGACTSISNTLIKGTRAAVYIRSALPEDRLMPGANGLRA
jgi:hypothetical protein